MGGYGSGWHRYDKRQCVEDGLTLRASGYKPFVAEAHAEGCLVGGRSTWGRAGQVTDRIGFTYTPEAADLDGLAEAGGGIAGRVELTYDCIKEAERESVTYPLAVEVRPCRFGGWRVYVRCPLSRNGQACGRRCEKVYLPPGARYFGCRTCHRLTYRSAQEAHHFDGLFKRLGKSMGMNPRDVERVLSARY